MKAAPTAVAIRIRTAAQLLLHEVVDLQIRVPTALRQPVLVFAGLTRDEALLEYLFAGCM